MDLRSRYLGLELRTPLVASSSPLTGTLDGLRRLEDAGAGAAVLPSLFEEQIEGEALALHGALEAGTGIFAEALDYLPEPADGEREAERYLELVAAARSALHIPVIASLNGTTLGGWTRFAQRIESAGAHALELNLYQVAADPAHSSAELERRDLELVATVRSALRIPLAVKLSPFFTGLAHFARELVSSGASGLVLFNRFYQPDLDLETLEVAPHLVLSRSEEIRLPLRWIGILRRRVAASLGATSGVHGAEDVLKLLLAGADATMLASGLLQHGLGLLGRIERELCIWMEEREYDAVEQLKGSVSQIASPDPEAFERANYRRTLRSFSSAFRS
ncbi:MAG TPA: dihydroorotate dehydrogenase-like protein [Myxococcota bacterium]|nr:dihydroorotate dehydrogenase-like protein [Myxococcota bacterium]